LSHDYFFNQTNQILKCSFEEFRWKFADCLNRHFDKLTSSVDEFYVYILSFLSTMMSSDKQKINRPTLAEVQSLFPGKLFVKNEMSYGSTLWRITDIFIEMVPF